MPCLYYSDHILKLTKVVKPFDDMDLASRILRMVTRHWLDQNELIQATVSQSACKFLEALECIEKAFLTNKDCDRSSGNAKAGDSANKQMVSLSKHIPKKHHTDA